MISHDDVMRNNAKNQNMKTFELDCLRNGNCKTYNNKNYESLNEESLSETSCSVEFFSTSASFSSAKHAKDLSILKVQSNAIEPERKLTTTIGDSDSSSISSLNSEELLKNQDFHANPLRFFVLLFYCCMSFSQVIISNTWGPIANSVLFAYPSWTSNVITLLANWSSLTVLIFIFPACWLLNKKGLRFSFLIASGLSCAGAGLRCLSMNPDVFVWLLHSCAILNAMAGILLGPSIVMLSSVWFPINERTTATGIGTALSLLGMAGSYQLGPLIVHTEPPRSTLNQFAKSAAAKIEETSGSCNELRLSIRQEIKQYMLICFGFELLIFIGTILVFPEKPLIPSSRASCISLVYKISFADSLRNIIRNRNIWALCTSVGLCTGMTVPWVSLLTIIFSHKAIPQTVAAQLGVWTIVCTCFLGLSVSRFSDMFQGHLKLTLLIFLLISTTMFVGILRLFLHWDPCYQEKLLLLVLLGISSSWSTQALFYELGSEIAYPIPESIIAGFMTWCSSLCTAISYIYLYIFPSVDDMWLTYGAVVYNIGAFCALLFVKETYNRSAIDKNV